MPLMHTINLTSAWDHFELPETNGDAAGWARWFGRPTAVEPPLEVWLVATADLLNRLWLNGLPLRSVSAASDFERVTPQLTGRNRLLLPPAGVSLTLVRGLDHELTAGRIVTRRSALPPQHGRVMLVISEGTPAVP